MRILYYLEPYEELGKPLFRFATVRNHLHQETSSLLERAGAELQITMICSEAVGAAIRSAGLMPRVGLVQLAQEELRAVFPTYLEASARWYNRDFEADRLQHMVNLCSAKLGSFEPDVIVCYESNAPFLQALFPRALFLHDTLGIFSRAPFPETSALDPFGIGKDSYLRRFQEQLRTLPLTSREADQLETLKHAYRSAQSRHSPVQRSQVRKGFEQVVLLPLQVSRYFMFDENCPAELRGVDQRGLTRHVLENIDPKIGVYVTMHPGEAKLFDEGFRRELAARFPNFLYLPDLQRIRWASQHILPHVDGVVTVSSAVGLQALIWDLPVVTLGRSHVSALSAGSSLSDLPRLLQHEGARFDGALYHLLTHYYPLIGRYHHDGDWFARFLARSLEKSRRGELGFDFFEPIDEPATVMAALVEELRPELYESEVTRSVGRQLEPSKTAANVAISRSMDRADLVSFDVFDTLVTRPLIEPQAVFDLIAPKAVDLFREHDVELSPRRLRVAREDGGRLAVEDARARGSEEYDLRRAYEHVCLQLGAPVSLAEQLEALEVETELAIHVPRESGRLLFQEALEKKKRIVLISDMFLAPQVVAAILERCGYAGYAKLYVSSEYGLLKKTGKLYRRVRELEGRPRRWVHVGDNPKVDVSTASRLGIDAHHLPSITDQYLADPYVKQLWRDKYIAKTLGSALQHGVISRRFYDRPGMPARASRFDGSAYRLGYEAGGPLLLSFVQWIYMKARRDGVSDLYFLSRDGFLPKQIYELVYGGLPDAPRAHYLYGSRRALTVPALRTARDIVRSLELKFSKTRLIDVIRDRFGVSPTDIVAGSLEASGFQSIDDAVHLGNREQRERLETFLTLNAQVILEQAARERETTSAYLESEGLLDRERVCSVVDLGHNASLQMAIIELTGRADLGGYYLATFFGARHHYAAGTAISAYLLEFEESEVSDHVYCENVGLFEFLFLPPCASLQRMSREADGTFRPIFVEGDETRRFAVAEELHRGILDFCRDVVQASAGQPSLFDISKNDALAAFARYASQPERADAAIVDGVSFVDAFGGSAARYLIASPLFTSINPVNYPRFESLSWWKAGARVVAAKSARFRFDPDASNVERKLRKLLRDPRSFVQDMRVMSVLKKVLAAVPGAHR